MSSFTVWLYEPFSNVLVYSNGIQSVTTSTSLLGTTSVAGNQLTFASSGLNISAPSTQYVVVRDNSGSVFSNVVNVNPGRFTLPNGYPSNLYIREPVSIELDTSAAMTSIYATTTIAPGLGLTRLDTSGNRWALAGTPTLQSPATIYPIFGANASNGYSVSTAAGTGNITFAVNSERIQLFPSLSVVSITGMQQDVPITPYSVTPSSNVSRGSFFYSWNALPSGLRFTDNSGTPQSAPFFPTDASLTIVLRGTPTSNALMDVSAGLVTGLYGSRTSDFLRSSNISFQYSFVESILFKLPTSTIQLYSNAPVPSSTPTFTAATYFGTHPILGIMSSDLRSDLSINYTGGVAYLTGTPGAGFPSGSYNFTLTASNGYVTTKSPPIQMTVGGDSVTMAALTDTCFNFVLSRDLASSLAGYYPSPITFRATSKSGQPITYSMIGLQSTGITIGSASGTLIGVPSNVQSLSEVKITAVASQTGASATVDISAAILSDRFTFADISLSAIQNVAITPAQVSATSLSGRVVTTYSSANLPTGLFISPIGVISGTPTSTANSFTVVGSTGYASDSRTYTFTNTPDALLFYPQSTQNNISIPASQTLKIPMYSTSYSGLQPSNFHLSSNAAKYGITVDSSTGTITTLLTSGIPPATVLPAQDSLAIDCSLNGVDLSSVIQLNTQNAYVATSLIAYTDTSSLPYHTTIAKARDITTKIPQWTGYPSLRGEVSSYSSRYAGPFSNTVIATLADTGTQMFRIKNFGSLSDTSYQAIQLNPNGDLWLSSVTKSSTLQSWYAIGVSNVASPGYSVTPYLVTSTNDGVTWTNRKALSNVLLRNMDADFSTATRNPDYYTTYGSACASVGGFILVGGYSDTSTTAIVRSSNSGTTFVNTSTDFIDVAGFCVDKPAVIIAVGSSGYKAGQTRLNNAKTIEYSIDNGAIWNDVTNGFNYRGDSVVFGSNVWLASGVDYGVLKDPHGTLLTGYYPSLRYSTTGTSWNTILLDNTIIPSSSPISPPIGIGPILFDTQTWYVYMTKATGQYTLYTHPIGQNLTSGWTAYPQREGPGPVNRLSGLGISPVISPTGLPIPETSTMQFEAGTSPPQFTNTQTSYQLYQYMPFSLTVNAIGCNVYYFVNNSTLPRGITFNAVTGRLSGTPVQTGRSTINVFAQDGSGVSILPLTLSVDIPRVLRQQDNGASAYTAYLRNYTLASAAQSARDHETYPDQTVPLGEFMAPAAPSVISASNCCT